MDVMERIIEMIFKMLNVRYGDCFIISCKNFKDEDINILVDGGPRGSYKKVLKDELKELRKLDYIFVTHIDHDHIKGIIELFQDTEMLNRLKIKRIYFNDYDSIVKFEPNINTSADERDILSGLINKFNNSKSREEEKIEVKSCYVSENDIEDGLIYILSPDKNNLSNLKDAWTNTRRCEEDDYNQSIESLIEEEIKDDQDTINVENSSSIAFLLEAEGKKILMMGDADPSVVVKSLKNKYGLPTQGIIDKKIEVDVVKLSHHGGKNSVNNEFLETIKCDKYLISTDGSYYGHPYKKTLAHIIKKQSKPVTFYLNYPRGVMSEKEIRLGLFNYIENNQNKPFELGDIIG